MKIIFQVSGVYKSYYKMCVILLDVIGQHILASVLTLGLAKLA